jgi:hypothetical protein
VGEIEFRVVAERAPNMTDEELRRRLAGVYRLLLAHRPASEVNDGGGCGNQTRTTSGGTSSSEDARDG